MNKSIVLDASALLALLNQESGHRQIEEVLPNAVMSAVNVSEVISVLIRNQITDEEARNITADLVKEIIPFDESQAYIAASLIKKTKRYGLSFGDRACLALAKVNRIPVLAADKIWSKLDVADIKIKLIR